MTLLSLLLYIKALFAAISQMGGTPQLITQEGTYSRYAVADSCYVDLYEYEGDSLLIVETICAPVCASHAHVYNKQWVLLHDCMPDSTLLFPQAHIDRDGRIMWTDNKNLILDETEQQLQTDASDEAWR